MERTKIISSKAVASSYISKQIKKESTVTLVLLHYFCLIENVYALLRTVHLNCLRFIHTLLI